MVGRPKDNRRAPKKAPIRKNNVRTLETRGKTYKEPALIGFFWRDHTMDQIHNMTEEELTIAIDIWIEDMIKRAIKNNKMWDFPMKEQYQRILPIPKKSL